MCWEVLVIVWHAFASVKDGCDCPNGGANAQAGRNNRDKNLLYICLVCKQHFLNSLDEATKHATTMHRKDEFDAIAFETHQEIKAAVEKAAKVLRSTHHHAWFEFVASISESFGPGAPRTSQYAPMPRVTGDVSDHFGASIRAQVARSFGSFANLYPTVYDASPGHKITTFVKMVKPTFRCETQQAASVSMPASPMRIRPLTPRQLPSAAERSPPTREHSPEVSRGGMLRDDDRPIFATASASRPFCFNCAHEHEYGDRVACERFQRQDNM